MIDFQSLDLSNALDKLKIVRELMHFLNNIQWLLFILVILFGVYLGFYIFNQIFGGKI